MDDVVECQEVMKIWRETLRNLIKEGLGLMFHPHVTTQPGSRLEKVFLQNLHPRAVSIDDTIRGRPEPKFTQLITLIQSVFRANLFKFFSI